MAWFICLLMDKPIFFLLRSHRALSSLILTLITTFIMPSFLRKASVICNCYICPPNKLLWYKSVLVFFFFLPTLFKKGNTLILADGFTSIRINNTLLNKNSQDLFLICNRLSAKFFLFHNLLLSGSNARMVR